MKKHNDDISRRVAYSLNDKRTSAVREDMRRMIAAKYDAQVCCSNLTWAEKIPSLQVYPRGITKGRVDDCKILRDYGSIITSSGCTRSLKSKVVVEHMVHCMSFPLA